MKRDNSELQPKKVTNVRTSSEKKNAEKSAEAPAGPAEAPAGPAEAPAGPPEDIVQKYMKLVTDVPEISSATKAPKQTPLADAAKGFQGAQEPPQKIEAER